MNPSSAPEQNESKRFIEFPEAMVRRRSGQKVPQAGNFIEIETLAQVFFCEFCEIFINIFIEHLR